MHNYDITIKKRKKLHIFFDFLVLNIILMAIVAMFYKKSYLLVILSLIFTLVLSLYLVYAQDTSETPEEDPIKEQKRIVKERRIKQLFMDGVNYYIQRDFKNASDKWDQVLGLDPDHEKAKEYYEKAFNLYDDMQQNYFKGLELFN